MTVYHEGRIILIEGAQRSGKTLLGSLFGANACMRGKTVWSNLEFRFPHEPIDFYALTLQNDIGQLRNGLIFIDELNFLSDGRDSGKDYSKDFTKFALQVKKLGITFVGTTHLLDYVDRRLRENFDLLIRTRAFPVRRPDGVPPTHLKLHVQNGPNQDWIDRRLTLQLTPRMLGLYDSAHVYNPFRNMPSAKKKVKAKGSTRKVAEGVIEQ